MKNLNNAYMTEMSQSEMQEINGGWIGLAIKAALIIAGLLYAQKAR
jgi:lactobin A/cerein 7B family class IIb bacteriocin